MALYIFGIGGTGARVIKALTMLLAAGVEIGNTNAIIPVLIDPDNSNGDLTRTLELLRLYRNIRQHTEQSDNKFFYNEIKSLSTAEAGNTTDEYHFAINGIGNKRFKEFIEINTMTPVSQAMAQLLFSENNLESDMQVGFKGNPNIGSIVLNRFKESSVFKAFANSFNQGDRIVIIGSIFGGTGAAGLPLLIKNLRDADPLLPKHELLRNAPIAAISVLPYFDVQGDTSIDSNTFIAKTKAALTYYAANLCRNNSVNALYYLGDAISNTHHGADGAAEQRNKAHFVELAAALAIADFMRYDSSELLVDKGKAQSPRYFEYGLKEEVNQIELKHLGLDTFNTAGKSLTQYFLFQKFFRDFYGLMPPNTAWMKNGNNQLTIDSFDKRMLGDLNQFNNAFDEWLAEMEQSRTSFKPFRRNADEKGILDAVIGFDEKKSLFDFIEAKGVDRYSKILSKKEAGLKSGVRSEAKLFNLFYTATKEIIKERIER